MIVVLNKCDMLPPEGRVAHIDKLKKGLSKVLSSTRFSGATMVGWFFFFFFWLGVDELIGDSVSCSKNRHTRYCRACKRFWFFLRINFSFSAGSTCIDYNRASSNGIECTIGICSWSLLHHQRTRFFLSFSSSSSSSSDFIYFAGAILTGTILSGTLRVGDTIEIPALKASHHILISFYLF